MDQIPKDDHSFRSPLLTEPFQSQQCGLVLVTGKWNAAGLEDFGLAQVQIGHEQFSAGGSPDGFLS
jgi:hypothetical protein